MARYPHYDQMVFSGGGTRCFWQGGFLDAIREKMTLAPARVTGVSGGALSSACFLSGRGQRLLEVMTGQFRRADHNVSWHSFGEDGVTPHQRIYRAAVEETLDREAAQRIADGPAWQVLLGHPPGGDWAKLTGAAATAAYEAELHTVNAPHFGWARKMGMTTSLVDARQAARDGRLVELVCAAAVIPPLFEPPRWEGKAVIDGGMCDQAPMPEPDEGRTLILLTRRYSNIPDIPGRDYVAPSDETPADKIDFTDPQKIEDTFAQGAADGRRYLATYET